MNLALFAILIAFAMALFAICTLDYGQTRARVEELQRRIRELEIAMADLVGRQRELRDEMKRLSSRPPPDAPAFPPPLPAEPTETPSPADPRPRLQDLLRASRAHSGGPSHGDDVR